VYRVYVTPSAWQEIRSLPGHMRQRVRRAVDDLQVNPRPPGSEGLRTLESKVELRRIRLDRWRVVYGVSDAEEIVDVLAVRKRPPYDYGDLEALLAEVQS